MDRTGLTSLGARSASSAATFQAGRAGRGGQVPFFGCYGDHLAQLSDESDLGGRREHCPQGSGFKNWRSNQKNSGFLPEERVWMTKRLKVVDAQYRFRTQQRQTSATRWSNRGTGIRR